MLPPPKKYSQKNFNILFFVMLYATNFCGFAPIADLYPRGNMTYELPLLTLMLYCGTKIKGKNEYKIWLFLLFATLLCNHFSTMYFEGRGFVDAIRASSFINYLFLFFPINSRNHSKIRIFTVFPLYLHPETGLHDTNTLLSRHIC